MQYGGPRQRQCGGMLSRGASILTVLYPLVSQPEFFVKIDPASACIEQQHRKLLSLKHHSMQYTLAVSCRCCASTSANRQATTKRLPQARKQLLWLCSPRVPSNRVQGTTAGAHIRQAAQSDRISRWCRCYVSIAPAAHASAHNSGRAVKAEQVAIQGQLLQLPSRQGV